MLDHAQHVQGIGVAGVRCENLPVATPRLVEAPGLLVPQGGSEGGVGDGCWLHAPVSFLRGAALLAVHGPGNLRELPGQGHSPALPCGQNRA
jgi:hypothetical protein